ncbi:hypothetical protein L208DRAFT_1463057 [Tricholoma matsutake]|nr:hypothetical protein L208DRAFT_1463057 [Tricholoma matsutake 945]
MAADIESHHHAFDSKSKNSYLARQQGSKYAIIAAYFSKWHRNVNEKNSIAQSITKVKAVERINRNPKRSTAAPRIPYNPVPIPHTHAELQGQLPQHPHIDISQYLAVVPDHQMHSQRQPRVPVVNSLPTSRTILNTANEGSSS